VAENDSNTPKPVIGKKLYDYQQQDIDTIFERIHNAANDYNLLYQLPTGGGKTVIFSEIARRFIAENKKKVWILTHRIELSRQTASMIEEFGIKNKVIDSSVKELPDQEDYMCFVAMVETLNNRLQDQVISLENVGLVIIDEAHYNSFRKLFKYFDNCFILGVTATPLSSNIKLPMKDNYRELIVGSAISNLVNNGFLANLTTYSYEVGLGTLKIGINGDYTVKSSEMLYSSSMMQSKLLFSYNQHAKGKKVLIFNAGISTSKQVYETFKGANIEVRHLDNSHSKAQRKEILEWFKNKPDAVLTSVGILTTGFDEPTIDVIVLNRATKSLSLYFQMIGRGSRVTATKKNFEVIDLGNNAARFGLWTDEVDWNKIFIAPDYFLENIITDEMIERAFKYSFPDEIREKFSKSTDIDFNVEDMNALVLKEGHRSAEVLNRSMVQHLKIVMENSDSLRDALGLFRDLEHDIADRVRRYCYCITNATRNFREWTEEDYKKKLRAKIMDEF